MNDIDTFAVDRRARLDHFLRDTLPHLSRRHLRHLIETREVLVNGRPARKGDTLRPGDTVSLSQSLSRTTSLRAQPDLGLTILFEDAAVAAVDKPCGMPSVAQRVTDRDTVANYVAGRFPETAGIDGKRLESGLVHRLDSATSGILLVGRSQDSYRELRRQFTCHAVEKTYLAVTHGRLEASGTLTAALQPCPGRADRVEVADAESATARPAESSFRVLQATPSASLVEVRIRSGARHQIRVHLAWQGHPIIGDQLYSEPTDTGRMLLHAHSVRFAHPGSGTATMVRSPIPADYRAALDSLGLRQPPAANSGTDPGRR